MIHAGVALARSSRNAMEETRKIFEVLQSGVVDPTILKALWLIPLSALAEVVGAFPTSVVLAGQLLLLESKPTFSLFIELAFLVSLPIGIGTALGSLPHYGLAYFGGKPAIEKFKKYTRVSWEDIERFEIKFFRRWYDEFIFLGLRSLPLVPTVPLNLLAGILRMKLSTYIFLTIVGVTLRMIIITAIFGYGGGGVLNRFLDL